MEIVRTIFFFLSCMVVKEKINNCKPKSQMSVVAILPINKSGNEAAAKRMVNKADVVVNPFAPNLSKNKREATKIRRLEILIPHSEKPTVDNPPEIIDSATGEKPSPKENGNPLDKLSKADMASPDSASHTDMKSLP